MRNIFNSQNSSNFGQINDYQSDIKISNEGGNQLLGKGVKFLSQLKQNAYPYSNSVITLSIYSSQPQPISIQDLNSGSGVIVNVQGKKYIASVCHLFYERNIKQWFKSSFALFKKECRLNNIREKMQIKHQMISYNSQYIQEGSPKDELIFVQIDSNLQKYIQSNDGLEIIFDWKQIHKQDVYLMGFPYDQNSKKIDMTDIKNYVSLHLCFRKLMPNRLSQNNQFFFYKTTTQPAQSGGALMIKKKNKYYLIGLHLGQDDISKQFNIGLLLTSDMKTKFPQIFLKRERPKYQKQNQNHQKQQNILSTNKVIIVEDENGYPAPIIQQQNKKQKQNKEKNKMSQQVQVQQIIDNNVINTSFSYQKQKQNAIQICNQIGFQIQFNQKEQWIIKSDKYYYYLQYLKKVKEIKNLSNIKFQCVVELSLRGCNIDDTSLFVLLDNIQPSIIKRINFTHNKLKNLSSNISKINHVEQLDLSYNNLTKKAAKKIKKFENLKILEAQFYKQNSLKNNLSLHGKKSDKNIISNQLQVLLQMYINDKLNGDIGQLVNNFKNLYESYKVEQLILWEDISQQYFIKTQQIQINQMINEQMKPITKMKRTLYKKINDQKEIINVQQSIKQQMKEISCQQIQQFRIRHYIQFIKSYSQTINIRLFNKQQKNRKIKFYQFNKLERKNENNGQQCNIAEKLNLFL